MPTSSAYLANVRFMVVDANPFMRTVIKSVLLAFGAQQLVEASDGAEAVRLIPGVRPDIVVTEWELPILNGVELTKWVRNAPDSPDTFVPVIMVTAHSEFGRIVAARDAGVHHVVTKPMSAKALLRQVIEVIERPRPFVQAKGFFGPDRRRRNLGSPVDGDRRGGSMVAKVGAAHKDGLSQRNIRRLLAGQSLLGEGVVP